MQRFPAAFVSHGSPMLALEDCPARRFLSRFGAVLGRPRAILVISAHWESETPTLSLASAPETIYDFRGFDPALRQIRYPAPGAPALAVSAGARLVEAGFDVETSPDRGLDHGAWVPLSLMYPAADIPVVQLSMQPQRDPAHHYRLGQALRPLRDEGVLILGTGAVTHNLGEVSGRPLDGATPRWTADFAEWIAAAATEGRMADLLDYRARAPFAERNQPSDDHLLPFFVPLGAGTAGVMPRRVHASYTYGVLAMDNYVVE